MGEHGEASLVVEPAGHAYGTVLLLGGNGYIGRTLCEHFASSGLARRLVIADLRLPEAAWIEGLRASAPEIEVVTSICDVRSELSPQLNVQSADWIINLAAVHREPGHAQHEYFDANVPGARNVCEFAEQLGCDEIVFTSSIAV